MKIAFFGFLVFLSASSAFAEYQGEVVGGYGERDYDDDGIESSVGQLSLRYYLSPVDDAQAPVRLAPFMQRQSFLVGEWSDTQTSFGSSSSDQEMVTLAGDFQLGASPFRLGGGMTQLDLNGEKVEEYFANVDWYYLPHGAVSLLGSQRSDNDDLNLTDVSEAGFSVAQVFSFGDNYFFLQGRYLREEGTLQVAGSSSDVPAVTYSRSLFASWYPNRQVGLGVAWQEQSTKYYELFNSEFEAESTGYLFVIQFDPSDRLGASLSAGPGNEKVFLGWGSGSNRSEHDYTEVNASLTWRF